MSGSSEGSNPGMGGSGGGELGVGHPRTLVLTLITAGFLRGQDWVMVSLLPPQSDATLPGPARLEGEPQGDLMQAPGLPGSPVPQNVSTWYLTRGAAPSSRPVTPSPGDLLGSALSLPAVSKYPVTPRSRGFGGRPLLIPSVWGSPRAGLCTRLSWGTSHLGVVCPHRMRASKSSLRSSIIWGPPGAQPQTPLP